MSFTTTPTPNIASDYRDPSQPIEARVQDLLNCMTLDEKLAQLGSVWVFELLTQMQFDATKADDLMPHGLGQITRVGGASSLTPADGAALANAIQKYLVENTRLGIPAIVHEECISGYMARNATCFPQIIGLASTWQPELAKAMASVVRIQMRAAGAQQGLSPVIDVTRDPRWGRVEETFGEDPYLVSQMGVNFVRGLQGNNWHEGVIATAKHFVGYGLPEGGMNWAPAQIPPRELRQVFMQPFEAAVQEANLQSVMHAYHEIDGIPCAASKTLLTDILRDEWGFDGVVVSDYFGIDELYRTHQLAEGRSDSARLALEAGIDVELPTISCYGDSLREAVQSGLIDESLIDRSVALILRHKFMLGLFEQPYIDVDQTSAVFDTPDQRRLAREIAQKSMILLKNENELLPLSKNLGSIAVVGPNAHTTRHLIGDYAYPCHIESLVEMRDETNVFDMPVPDDIDITEAFVPMQTILQAVRDKVSASTTVYYAKGCDITGDDTAGLAEAVDVAQQADVALVFVGGKSGLIDSATCGEARDRAELGLTGVQAELIKAVHATGTPTVVILVNGRPLAINWTAEHIPAVLEAWLPGEEGGEAVADILFGDATPGGKLPITVPRAAGQVPIYYNHKPSGGRSHWKGHYVDLSNEPLYPFGFGLSYTTFELSDLQLNQTTVDIGGSIEISATVTNIGQHSGDEVVQLYIRDVLASVTRPVKELKGFQRVSLQPGQRQTVVFTLHSHQLGFYNQAMDFVVEPGDIEVMVGNSSQNLPLTSSFELTGQPTIVTDKVFFSQVKMY